MRITLTTQKLNVISSAEIPFWSADNSKIHSLLVWVCRYPCGRKVYVVPFGSPIFLFNSSVYKDVVFQSVSELLTYVACDWAKVYDALGTRRYGV